MFHVIIQMILLLFRNAVLQCLFHSTSFAKQVQGEPKINDLPEDSVLKCFSNLLKYSSMEKLDNLFIDYTRMFKKILEQKNSLYYGYEQHDSFELLGEVLDNMRMEINLIIRQKEFQIESESDWRSLTPLVKEMIASIK